MTSSILGLGVASPVHQMTQDEAVKMFIDIVCEDKRQARLAKVLFRKSEVETRNTVVPHTAAYTWCEKVNDGQVNEVEQVGASQAATAGGVDMAVASKFIPPVVTNVVPGKSLGPTTRERMEMYACFATDLACQSSEKALAQSNVDPSQITHLITVTCTGFDAPGVDVHLIERLQLPRTTQRIQVGFMGCHGAINGLRTALAITSADPQAKVLLCAVELCSLHYRFVWDPEGIIGNALFADGSGALVIGSSESTRLSDQQASTHAGLANGRIRVEAGQNGREKDKNRSLGYGGSQSNWTIQATGSVLLGGSKEAMSWQIGDHGFDMRIGSEVGDKIEEQLAPWLTQWLADQGLKLSDIEYWGVHPGGPRIVSAVQSSLNLSDDDLSISRMILRQHGNMSSPTVLFILEEFRRIQRERKESDHRHCLLLGFGPGLFAEAALLRTPNELS